MLEAFVLPPDRLAGPLLAILLQATFLVTEWVPESQNLSRNARRRSTTAASSMTA